MCVRHIDVLSDCRGLTVIIDCGYNTGPFQGSSRLLEYGECARIGEEAMDQRMRRVLSLQLASLLLVSLGVYVVWGGMAAKAAWFGVFIATTNTLLIIWRIRPNNKAPGKPANLNEFIRSWLERYLLVGVLLALGLGSLKLLPLSLLSGFILGQLIWILAPLTIKET